MVMMKASITLCTCLLIVLGQAQGSSTTRIVPFAQEETKKRSLLHRHLHDCSCNNTDQGGRRRHRNLADATRVMLERRRLSESNVEDLINNLGMTLRGDATTTTTTTTTASAPTDEVPVTVPSTTTTTTTTTTAEPPSPIADIASLDDQVLALQMADVLQGAMGDLDQVAVYTKHYQDEANNQQVVNQDVLGIVNLILDFIFDLIQLVIGVIQSIISLVINTIVAIINLVVGVILAIFQFIADIIQSIIDKILNVFSADSSSSATTTDEDAAAGNNDNKGPLLSFFPANSNNNNNDDPDETVPALQVIYETFVQGVEGIGMADIDQVLTDNADLLGGALAFGTTTAPLILTEFIGASTTNAILCLIGATESVIDGSCPTTTTTTNSTTLSEDSICAACEACAELDP